MKILRIVARVNFLLFVLTGGILVTSWVWTDWNWVPKTVTVTIGQVLVSFHVLFTIFIIVYAHMIYTLCNRRKAS